MIAEALHEVAVIHDEWLLKFVLHRRPPGAGEIVGATPYRGHWCSYRRRLPLHRADASKQSRKHHLATLLRLLEPLLDHDDSQGGQACLWQPVRAPLPARLIQCRIRRGVRWCSSWALPFSITADNGTE